MTQAALLVAYSGGGGGGVSSSLSGTVNTPSNIDVSSFAAYAIKHNASSTVSAELATKNASVFTSWGLYGGATDNTTLAFCTTISWTDATGGSGSIPAGDNSGVFRSFTTPGGVEAGVNRTVNADTTARKVRVYGKSIDFSGNVGLSCRATLQDGSGLTSVQTQSAGDTNVYFEFTYNAASSGQSLLIELFPATLSAGAAIGLGGITYGT